jgi:soluble lytic murein transglycosylase-like protein
MAGSTRCLVHVLGLLLGAAALAAQAQPCHGPLPKPGTALMAAPGAEKFRLIAQQCTVLSEPARQQRATQLDLYQGSASVGIAMPEPAASAPAPAASAADAAKAPPSRSESRVMSLAPVLTEAARRHDLDPLLLHAIAHVESRHDTQAVSHAGARGAMQVMPATARRFGVADPERSLHDAQTNVGASAALLRQLQRRYDNDLRLVLAAYNAGEGAVEKHGRDVPPYAETQAYVRKVTEVYRRLQSEFSVSESGELRARGSKS